LLDIGQCRRKGAPDVAVQIHHATHVTTAHHLDAHTVCARHAFVT
jgi:hypothetical protein